MTELRFLLNRNASRRCYELFAYQRCRDVTYRAKPVEFVREEDANEYTDPILTIQDNNEGALQSLLDEMWRCGLRPSEYHSQGQIDTMKYHLEDMRKIAFMYLHEIEKDNNPIITEGEKPDQRECDCNCKPVTPATPSCYHHSSHNDGICDYCGEKWFEPRE